MVGLGFLAAGYAPVPSLGIAVILCAAVVASLALLPVEEWLRRRERIDAVNRIREEWNGLGYFADATTEEWQRLDRLFHRLYWAKDRADLQ